MGVVDVGGENALMQIIQDDGPGDAIALCPEVEAEPE